MFWACGSEANNPSTENYPGQNQQIMPPAAGSASNQAVAGTDSTLNVPTGNDSGTSRFDSGASTVSDSAIMQALDAGQFDGAQQRDGGQPANIGRLSDASQTTDANSLIDAISLGDTNGNSDARDTASDVGSTIQPLCDPPPFGGTTVYSTIVVQAGQVYDGQCQRFIADRALGDGSQDENQDPVFRLENGARLINVVLGSPAADGIHCHGNATLANITWEDIGEDALTIKESGTVEIEGGAAYNGDDKVFQINAASTFKVSNFRADRAGKFIRQNGGTTFKIDVFIDNCDISNMDEAIFRTDSSVSTVTMTNTRYSNIGDRGNELWYNVNPSNITVSNNTQY